MKSTKQYLDKAIILDPDLMEVQLETGWYYYHCKMNYPKALQILENLPVQQMGKQIQVFQTQLSQQEHGIT